MTRTNLLTATQIATRTTRIVAQRARATIKKNIRNDRDNERDDERSERNENDVFDVDAAEDVATENVAIKNVAIENVATENVAIENVVKKKRRFKQENKFFF
jgi:Na+-transporting NADH:ubiquinone oxidoreductase subunit NqrC